MQFFMLLIFPGDNVNGNCRAQKFFILYGQHDNAVSLQAINVSLL